MLMLPTLQLGCHNLHQGNVQHLEQRADGEVGDRQALYIIIEEGSSHQVEQQLSARRRKKTKSTPPEESAAQSRRQPRIALSTVTEK